MRRAAKSPGFSFSSTSSTAAALREHRLLMTHGGSLLRSVGTMALRSVLHLQKCPEITESRQSLNEYVKAAVQGLRSEVEQEDSGDEVNLADGALSSFGFVNPKLQLDNSVFHVTRKHRQT